MGLLVLGGAVAVAQERRPPPTPFPRAKSDFEAAFAGTDAARLARAVAELARAGLISDAKAEKQYTRAALKRCLKRKEAEVRIAAVKGYGTLRLPKSVRDLKPLLSQSAKGRVPHELALVVVETWGALTEPGTHKELLAIAKKPAEGKKRRELGYEAARALRNYKVLPPRKRFEVLSALVIVFDQLFAIQQRRPEEDSPDRRWFAAVEPGMVEAFNALAGSRCEEYYECYDWWQQNRRKLKEAK